VHSATKNFFNMNFCLHLAQCNFSWQAVQILTFLRDAVLKAKGLSEKYILLQILHSAGKPVCEGIPSIFLPIYLCFLHFKSFFISLCPLNKIRLIYFQSSYSSYIQSSTSPAIFTCTGEAFVISNLVKQEGHPMVSLSLQFAGESKIFSHQGHLIFPLIAILLS